MTKSTSQIARLHPHTSCTWPHPSDLIIGTSDEPGLGWEWSPTPPPPLFLLLAREMKPAGEPPKREREKKGCGNWLIAVPISDTLFSPPASYDACSEWAATVVCVWVMMSERLGEECPRVGSLMCTAHGKSASCLTRCLPACQYITTSPRDDASGWILPTALEEKNWERREKERERARVIWS